MQRLSPDDARMIDALSAHIVNDLNDELVEMPPAHRTPVIVSLLATRAALKRAQTAIVAHEVNSVEGEIGRAWELPAEVDQLVQTVTAHIRGLIAANTSAAYLPDPSAPYTPPRTGRPRVIE